MPDSKKRKKEPETPTSSNSPRKKVSPAKREPAGKQKTLHSFFRPSSGTTVQDASVVVSDVTPVVDVNPEAEKDEWEEWPQEALPYGEQGPSTGQPPTPIEVDEDGWERWPLVINHTEQDSTSLSSPSVFMGTSETTIDFASSAGGGSSPVVTFETADTLSISTPSASPTTQQSCMMDVIKYDSDILPSYWKRGDPTPYRFLSDQFVLVDGQTGRLIITEVLTNMLRTIIRHSPADLLPALYLSSNSIAPPYEGIELGIGPQIMVKAITSISDMTSKHIKAAWDQKGDWGDVVVTARLNMRTLMKPKPLSVASVFQTLRKIAQLKGQGTVSVKTDLVKKMMVACQSEELRYLARTLVSHIRIGAVRTTILIALSHALLMEFEILGKTLKKEEVKVRFKEAEQILKECYAQVPNYNILVPLLLDPSVGLSGILKACKCQPGVPIRPMLGKITRDLTEVFEKMQGVKYCADFKYDGQRAQIHRAEDGRVTIFSRHLETMTDKYPDLVSLIPTFCSPPTTSFIMDSEVVAVDDNGRIQPFQTLTNRARKNVDVRDIKVGVKICCFDLMYLNGESLIKEPFRVRRDRMKEAFKVVEGQFGFVPQLESNDPEEVHDFLKKSLDAGCEGLMVKMLDKPPDTDKNTLLATYEPDKRTDGWLKVKKDYVEGLADSFDLVPIGAWYGTGRKAGWYSPFLMACYNPETEQYETLCKCMSGFSDAFYKEKLAKYAKGGENVIPAPKSYYVVSESLRPDVWFLPLEVWEIRGADLTLSPVHRAAAGKADEVRGISLRFPRFIRERDDKNPEDATTPDQIVEMFHKQRTRAPQAPSDNAEEEEREEAGEGDEELV
ncbi:hypothetical protein HK097_003612 [Rhizophlyctis rosea]|uniref:DNA ligase n=1 Tax=Rhizophlyctis rosea TaxID=64517 RepID=A0AAD5SGB9_9FUNG|nr:hypothetical protein HK097_003612 [Rhizophlyctis rosea]